MDDLPIDTTGQDLLADALMDHDTLRQIAAAALRLGGWPIDESTSVPDSLNSISEGGIGSADHWERYVPQVSQTTTDVAADVSWDEQDIQANLSSGFECYDTRRSNQATDSAIRNANEDTPAARSAHDVFSYSRNGSLPQLSQDTTSTTRDANENPEESHKVHELVAHDLTFGNHNAPQLSQPGQATAGAVESGATWSGDEKAVDGCNPFHDDIAVSRSNPKRRRVSGGGIGFLQPTHTVRGSNQTSATLAARPAPVSSGYHVPISTTVGDTGSIEWASSNAAGISSLSIRPQAPATTTGGDGTNFMPTSLSSTSGQVMTAATDLTQKPVFSTTGHVKTAAPARPEELDESPLRMIAIQSRAQIQSRIAYQVAKLRQSLPDTRRPHRIADQVDELGQSLRDARRLDRMWMDLYERCEILKECRGKLDAMLSDLDGCPPPWEDQMPPQ